MVTSTSKYAYIACDARSASAASCASTSARTPRPGEFNTYRSRIRTVRVDEILITAVACRTCEDAPCVIACTARRADAGRGDRHHQRGRRPLRWLRLVHRGVRLWRDLHQPGDQDGRDLRPVRGRGGRPAVRQVVSEGRARADHRRSARAEGATQAGRGRGDRTR